MLGCWLDLDEAPCLASEACNQRTKLVMEVGAALPGGEASDGVGTCGVDVLRLIVAGAADVGRAMAAYSLLREVRLKQSREVEVVARAA